MNTAESIKLLEVEWAEPQGSLWCIRMGHFDADIARRLLQALDNVTIEDKESIPKRLVSLLWYIPMFLEWQTERIVKVSPGTKGEFVRFVNAAIARIESLLGVP